MAGALLIAVVVVSAGATATGAATSTAAGDATATPAPAADAAADQRILVLELRRISVSAAEAHEVQAKLVEALQRAAADRVMSVDEVNAMAALQKDLSLVGCADETCIAQLAKYAQARLALGGSLGRLGGELILTLSLVDTKVQAAVGSGSRSAPDLAGLAAQLDDLVLEVLGARAAGGGARYSLPGGQTVSFAVFELKSLGLSKEVADNLSQVLAADIKAIDGTKVISRDDIAAMLQLESQRLKLDCNEASCFAEIGGALGVDQLVVGHAGLVGDRYVISLRIIDAKDPQVLSRVTETFAGHPSELVPALRFAARRLLGIDRTEPGQLHVAASEHEASIELDGKEVGRTPAPPFEQLAPGRYALHLAKPGFKDWRSDVFVGPGELHRVWAELEETPTQWVFWGFVAATAATVVSWAISGGIMMYADHEYTRIAGTGGPAEARTQNREMAKSSGLAASVSLGLSGAFAIGTGVAFFVTDWD